MLMLRGLDRYVQGLATGVGWISLSMGLLLTFAPEKGATLLGWGERPRLARAVGVIDLIIGPGLLLGRDRRSQWMLARAFLNAVIALIYAGVLATDRPRQNRAIGGAILMSALTVTDYSLSRRLREDSWDSPIRADTFTHWSSTHFSKDTPGPNWFFSSWLNLCFHSPSS